MARNGLSRTFFQSDFNHYFAEGRAANVFFGVLSTPDGAVLVGRIAVSLSVPFPEFRTDAETAPNAIMFNNRARFDVAHSETPADDSLGLFRLGDEAKSLPWLKRALKQLISINSLRDSDAIVFSEALCMYCTKVLSDRRLACVHGRVDEIKRSSAKHLNGQLATLHNILLRTFVAGHWAVDELAHLRTRLACLSAKRGLV